MSTETPCVFCSIAAGDLPAVKVHEDERTIAFMDINPSVRGHVLVIPRAHCVDLRDVGAEDLAACAQTAQHIARRVVEAFDADGVNLLQNTGRAAGQAVFHFHLHVLPRHRGDGLRNPLSPTPGDPDEIAAAAAAIRGD
jgi:histidine triad (HIT) family protein